MNKFHRIANALLTTCQKTHSTSPLPRPLVRCEEDFFRPLNLNDVPIDQWISGPIDTDFVQRFMKGQLTIEECRYIGFREQTGRPELIERTVLEVAGTVLACQLACHYGIAANVAGGTHHAHSTGGAGYTILNDLAVAAYVLTANNHNNGIQNINNRANNIGQNMDSLPIAIDLGGRIIQRVLVIDCDVHQGDGTAKIGAMPLLKDKLFTLSMHCASNYPKLKAHSTYDVGLPDGMQDDEYLEVLRENVNHAIEEINPDFVLYDAGVDVYKNDRLGRLNLSEDGIRYRDRFVLDRCVSLGIPVAAVVGGGYDQDVDALARRHAIVHEECSHVWRKYKMWNRV
jgi:acetoin utilization deacetylase AcuC-like enzyme